MMMKAQLKELWKRMRKKERCVCSKEGKRVMNGESQAGVAYIYYRTGKGNFASWGNKLNDTRDPLCRFCRNDIETDKDVALVCPYREEIRRK